ncbi:probable serine/threonine-protein kinase pats1 [Saccostrea cucullata]|uniref:probable serine/threonine-protein kinase pats1 n=1 Tax=Saccostrea cuccullata TaxID=36930 RepID=UPI002ED2C8A8
MFYDKVGVPREVLEWDQEARERYVEYAKRGTQTVHHARGMIVGCAGAGKTTLLKRLQGCSKEEIDNVKSTEGLEVHEEIFDLCYKTQSLKARNIDTGDKREDSSATNIDSKTLTFFDFGGQCAYYACHQIYLTRRAFYVVVVDASKRLDQKVDEKVCDQDGSVFSGWTYGDYFVFWKKSIHTYCGSEKDTDPKPTVLIVVTHWEEGNRQYQSKEALLNSLKHIFPKSTNLSMYITEDNVYFISFPLKPLQDLEKIVFDIALHQRWKENIPKEWAFFEIEINQRKHNEKILEVNDLTTKLSDKGVEVTLEQYEDMLRYYHDAGKVLYFNEEQLKKYVIIDVQWFIDAFKYIITDKLHFKGIDVAQEDWDEYYTTGNLKDGLLAKIWEHKGDVSYTNQEELEDLLDPDLVDTNGNLLLKFMQRLGLVALGQESHYVPCMNRKEMEEELSNLIKDSDSKSSVLIYRFTFLPFFFFFRLIVACMQEDDWEVLKTHGTSCLYRDTAVFSFAEYHIVISVTKESIQLQVLHSMPGHALKTDKTQKIQEKIENILHMFAGQFMKKLFFDRGIRCQMDSSKATAMDITEHFLTGKNIQKDDREKMCPLHQVINRHFINPKELTKYWKM